MSKRLLVPAILAAAALAAWLAGSRFLHERTSPAESSPTAAPVGEPSRAAESLAAPVDLVEAPATPDIEGSAAPAEDPQAEGARLPLDPRVALSDPITGRVLWPDGKPADNACVRFVSQDSEKEAWTDLDGRFDSGALEGTEPRRLTAVWTGGPFDGETGEFVGTWDDVEWQTTLDGVLPGTRDLVLVLERGIQTEYGSVLRGVVRDETGEPYDDFTVAASPGRFERQDSLANYLGRSELTRAFSGAGGAFAIDGVAPGTWTVLVYSHENSLSAPVEITLPDDRELEFLLPRGGRIEGIVLDAQGRGVLGEVFLQPVPPIGSFDDADWPERGIPTDADGTFGIPVITGTAFLYATSEFGSPSPIVSRKIGPRAIVSGIALELVETTNLLVEVLDEDGRPEPGIEVLVEDQGWKGGLRGFRSSRASDDAGRILFTNVPAATLEVNERDVHYHGFREELPTRSAEVALEPGDTGHVVLQRAFVVRLSGRVTAGGEPFANGHLTIRGGPGFLESTQTTASGQYSQLLPSPGNYEIVVVQYDEGEVKRDGTISRTGRALHSARVEVPTVSDFVFDVSCDAEGRVSGRVFGPGGRPVPGIEVSARIGGHRSRGGIAVNTHPDGTYDVSLPPGTYTIVVGERDSGDEPASSLTPAAREGIVVEAGVAVADIDFELIEGGTIEGRVLHEDGSASNEAIVTVFDDTTRWAAVTDLEGCFRIDGVRPGSVGILAAEVDVVPALAVRCALAAGVAEVGKTSDPVELVLAPAASLTACVQVGQGSPAAADVTIEGPFGLSGPGHLDEESGIYDFGPLPAGKYTVRARWKSKESSATVDLAPGEERTVELQLD